MDPKENKDPVFRHVLLSLKSVWGIVITFGLVMMSGGCVRAMGFISRVSTYEVITARQLLHELIIPHIVMLFGMGFLVGGIIFLVRRGVIGARMQHKAL